MSLCESQAPITLATGGCKSQGRWVGPDGKVRCSLHQIQEFGHGEPLVRVEDYESPANGPVPEEAPKPKRQRQSRAKKKETANG